MWKVVRIPAGDITNLHYNFVVAKPLVYIILICLDLSRAQRSLSAHLLNFKFDCIGNNQTDDELVIAGSLKVTLLLPVNDIWGR